VPLVALIVIAVAFVSMFLSLAHFLANKRCRRVALIFAAISCLGIPLGTLLGGLTIYGLTRTEISAELAPTV
jgi:hypothetical protein